MHNLTNLSHKGGFKMATTSLIQSGRQTAPFQVAQTSLLAKLELAFAASWSKESSYEPGTWSTQNSAWGQCGVTALIAQDFCGGRILTGEVNGVEHYWNQLPDGQNLDFTEHQFGKILSRHNIVEADRAIMLSYPDTVRRYDLLRANVENALMEVYTLD
jgi:hypothetical protein